MIEVARVALPPAVQALSAYSLSTDQRPRKSSEFSVRAVRTLILGCTYNIKRRKEDDRKGGKVPRITFLKKFRQRLRKTKKTKSELSIIYLSETRVQTMALGPKTKWRVSFTALPGITTDCSPAITWTPP
jgi:hypothetical protein